RLVHNTFQIGEGVTLLIRQQSEKIYLILWAPFHVELHGFDAWLKIGRANVNFLVKAPGVSSLQRQHDSDSWSHLLLRFVVRRIHSSGPETRLPQRCSADRGPDLCLE